MADRVFAALADPTRLAVVERLARGPATVSELAAPHAMSLPAFTKHLAVLSRAGLVHRRKTGRVVTCTLAPEPLAVAEAWVSDVRRYWERTLDRLEDLVEEET